MVASLFYIKTTIKVFKQVATWIKPYLLTQGLLLEFHKARTFKAILFITYYASQGLESQNQMVERNQRKLAGLHGK